MRLLPSLRRQLVVRLLLAMIPLFVLLWLGAHFATHYFINAAFDRSLIRRTYALADQVEVVRGQARVDLPVAAREILVFDQEDLLFHRVLDPLGRVIEGEQRMPGLPRGRSLLPGQLIVYDGTRAGEPVRVAAFALSLKGTSARGNVLIQVGETLSRRTAAAERATLAIMIPLILLTLAAAGIVAYGVRRGLQPVERLRDRIAARQVFDLSPVPQDDVPAEMRPFLDEINSLLARLSEAVDAQSRFVADAAHQLRTPIAGIRAQAETALAGGDNRNALAKITEAARNMGELVTRLLMLARVDAAETSLHLTPLDGASVAQACTRDWAPRALERGVEIGFDAGGGDTAMLGDALLLREMLGNLIDNALRYGATRIDVAVEAVQDQGVAWCVADDGPGIPEAERVAVLAPFHRLGAGSEGAGLGLTIAQRIAHLHGAHLRLTEGTNGVGLAVIVQFPRRMG